MEVTSESSTQLTGVSVWLRRVVYLLLLCLVATVMVGNWSRQFLVSANLWFDRQPFSYNALPGWEDEPIVAEGLSLRRLERSLPMLNGFVLESRVYITQLRALKFHFTGQQDSVTVSLATTASPSGAEGKIDPAAPKKLEIYLNDQEVFKRELPERLVRMDGANEVSILCSAGGLSVWINGRRVATQAMAEQAFTRLKIENFFSDLTIQKLRLFSADGEPVIDRRLVPFYSRWMYALAAAAACVVLLALAWLLTWRREEKASVLDDGLPAALFCCAPLWAGMLLPLKTYLWIAFLLPAAASLLLLLGRRAGAAARKAGPWLGPVFLLGALVLLVVAGGKVENAALRIGLVGWCALLATAVAAMIARANDWSLWRGLAALTPALFPAFLGLAALPAGLERAAATAMLLPAAVMLCLTALAYRKQMRLFSPLMILLVATTAGAAELGARHSALETHWRPLNVGATFEEHDDLFFVPKDLFADDVQYLAGRMNFRGRQATLEPEPGVFRVITLGGSNTWGDHLETNEHTFTGQLEEILNRHRAGKRIEVLNAGVKGLELFQIMLLFEHEVMKYHPDLAILYINFNDSLDRLGPFTLRELYGMKQQDRWGEIEQKIAAAKGESTSAWVVKAQGLLRGFRLYNGLVKAITAERGKLLKAVAAKIGALKPVNPVEDYRKNLLRVIEVCRQNKITLVLADEFFLLYRGEPQRKDTKIRVVMREEAQRRNVPYVDINGEFHRRADKNDLVFDFDQIHLNPHGHRQVAERLAEFIIENELIDGADAGRSD